MGRLLSAALMAITLLAGCGRAEVEAQARRVAEAYFQAVKEKDVERALSFYAKRFFETRSPEGWKQDFGLIADRLGALESFALNSSRWSTDFVPPHSGSYVTLNYQVKYRSHGARETLTLHRPFTRGEFRIIGHEISSEGFLRE